MIAVIPACRREIDALPEAVRGDLADALARLEEGLMLSMPLSRPMPVIGRGVHELRLRDKAGVYRVIYWIRRRQDIYLIHAFTKKSRQTPTRAIEISRMRIQEVQR